MAASALAHRHRRRRFRRLDVRRRLRAGSASGTLPRDAHRVRRHRHGGRGRSHAAGAARLQRAARARRGAASCARRRARSSSASSFATGICPGDSYVHPFGAFGELWGGVEFQHFWLRARQQGLDPPPLEEFSVAVRACRRNAFDFPERQHGALDVLRLRLSLRCQPVRRFPASLGPGPRRHARRGTGGRRRVDVRTGDIESLTLKSGQRISGDFFVDCSGFRSLLLGDKLQVPWEDWSALAALRSRLGRALRTHRRLHAVHALDRAEGRLDLAHSAAAPHRQRPRVLDALRERRRGARHLVRRSSTAARRVSRGC